MGRLRILTSSCPSLGHRHGIPTSTATCTPPSPLSFPMQPIQPSPYHLVPPSTPPSLLTRSLRAFAASIMAVPQPLRAFWQSFIAMHKPPLPLTAPPPPHLLAPLLLHLLNATFSLGHVPSHSNLAPISPIFKKGDPADTANYRPVAVSEPFLCLYANILNSCIISLTKARELRAPSQAGFRPALSTLHPLFALQHFVDESTRTATPLYCCFLDPKVCL